jgi:hypothetical protein
MLKKIISIILISSTLNCFSQKNSELAESTLLNFYDWYIKAVKERRTSDIYPQFDRAENGFTTLDFLTYKNNLKKLNFSNDFIDDVIESFEECKLNLNKLKYEEFKELDDLDDFEGMNCAFSNVYTWIWSMEPVDGVEILNAVLETKSKYQLEFKFYYRGTPDDEKFYNSFSRTATIELIVDIWLITSIK